MDFFAQQDLARRNTRLLLMLFVAALLLIVCLVFVVVTAALYYSEAGYADQGMTLAGLLSYLDWQRFSMVFLAVSALVGGVSLVRWLALSAGGKVVAEGAGGERVLPQSTDPAERRALNIVEEMALASNMPVPPLYVLNDERSVNAFAAGTSVANAVVAVTRGTLDTLTRDELQGVIAHEFSHILNGDMRLSIRLMALLKGITALADIGGFLLRSGFYTGSSRRRGKDGSGQLAIMGVGLGFWVLGSIGGLMAGLIKSAVSRQKEYLADASAVQFTRNPEGIGSALKVIGGISAGSLVHSARASEISHLFFAQALHRLWQGFATHPPLEKRIRRIEPQWNGQFIQRKVDQYASSKDCADVGVGRAAIVTAAIASHAVAELNLPDKDNADAQQPTISRPDAEFNQIEASLPDSALGAQKQPVPAHLVEFMHEPLGAQAVLLALLMDSDEQIASRQWSSIDGMATQGLRAEVSAVLPVLAKLHPTTRLPLTEMCLPALKSMSQPQYQRFRQSMLELAHADRQIELYEWCLFQLVSHYLAPEFSPQRLSRPRYRELQQVQKAIAQVLSMLVWEGLSDMPPEALFDVAAQALALDQITLLPHAHLKMEAFSSAVYQLADCYPLLKPRILKAMALAAGYDGILSAPEREIIAAIAAVMDCPVPDNLLV